MATDSVVPSTSVGAKRPAFRARRRVLSPAVKSRTAGTTNLRSGLQQDDRAKQHDHDRDQIVVKLLSLVKRVAFEVREHLPAHVELDDLIGAGVLGLLDAVRKFDARKHVKVETYARHRIRGAILDSLRSLDTASRDMRRKNKTAEQVYRKLEAKLGRSVNDGEMAQALRMSLKKWYRTVQELQAMGIDWLRPMQSAEMKQPNEETLAAHDAESQFDLCYRREQKEILARALACLPERERKIVSLYYEEEMSMKQIGEELGIDESRVSQLHSAAIVHLRNRVQAMLRSARPSTPPPARYGEPKSNHGMESRTPCHQ